MPTIRQIEEVFSPERIITICEDEFGPLAEQIAFNIMTKRTNSGADVNALGLPEETTGATAESLKTIHESTNGGLTVSFVGRKGIKNIDEGSSPQDVQEEFGSFGAFLNAIERWARAQRIAVESRTKIDKCVWRCFERLGSRKRTPSGGRRNGDHERPAAPNHREDQQKNYGGARHLHL